jgi:tetratricopeptide (TPR) repeat protein
MYWGRISCVAGLQLAAATLLVAIPAVAAPPDDRLICAKEDGDEAIAACTRAIESGKYKGRALSILYVNRGAEWSAKGQTDRAIADYNESIRLDPKHAMAFNNRGFNYTKKKDYDRAIQDFDQAIRIEPDTTRFNNRGNAYRAKGDIDRAIADYTAAIRLEPTAAGAFFNRGNAYNAKQQYDRAIADYSEAIRIEPSVSRYRGRCWSRAASGQLQAALDDCNQALRLRPNDADALDARGFTYLKLGQIDRAIADYDSALKADPTIAASLYGRGVAKEKKGDAADGSADVAAAKALQTDIAKEFAGSGVIAVNDAVSPAAPLPGQSPSAATTDCARAETHWKSAEEIKTLAVYEDHLARFPTCDFAILARAKIEMLKK